MLENKVAFYLMNEKGYTVLKSFLEYFGSDAIEYIVVSKDENVERDFYDEIVALCAKNNLDVFHNGDSIEISRTLYKFAVGWRWIIADNKNLIVLHDSLLPRYRGFAPLVNMLINGENVIGVTALWASNEYDKGDIILQKEISIEYPIVISDAISLISKLYSQVINEIYDTLCSEKELISEPQNEVLASYSVWRDYNDYFVDWNESATYIERFVNALGSPYLGARTFLDQETVVIKRVEVVEDIKIENRHVGKVIFMDAGYPVIICGEGLIKLKELVSENNESLIPLKKFRSRFGR